MRASRPVLRGAGVEIPRSTHSYIATKEAWLYAFVIIDLFSRKVVGWSMRDNMKAGLVLDAFEMAIKSRRPSGELIFHSEKGGQYKSKEFRRRLKKLGLRQSMAGVNHYYDNATAESFFGRVTTELIRDKIFADRKQADAAIFEYIEVYYNRLKLHSSLDYQAPDEFEISVAN